MRKAFPLLMLLSISFAVKAQTILKEVSLSAYIASPTLVDFDAYEKLMKTVKNHRKSHLVQLASFVRMSTQPGVIILDTRSDSMYNAKHIKGAIHLNFSDFTSDNLRKVIPSYATTILIYCNNNFANDQVYFATKGVSPRGARSAGLTLALNIPTYINLFGYGYENVYELSQTVSVNHPL